MFVCDISFGSSALRQEQNTACVSVEMQESLQDIADYDFNVELDERLQNIADVYFNVEIPNIIC